MKDNMRMPLRLCRQKGDSEVWNIGDSEVWKIRKWQKPVEKGEKADERRWFNKRQIYSSRTHHRSAQKSREWRSILFVLLKRRNCFSVRTSVQPFWFFLRPSVLPPAAATLSSVQPPKFFWFLTSLYWLLSLLYISYFAVTFLSA